MARNREYEQNVQPVLFSLSVPAITVIVSILPAFAVFFAVIWSVLFNFEESTRTHCKVYNFLPSISAAIGGFTPQKYVWRICIALHCAPRFLLALSYYGYHTSVEVGKHNEIYKAFAAFCSLLHIIENGALLTLSYVSSEDNYAIHENMFITFMVSSLLYMMLSCFVFSYGRTSNGRQLSRTERKSLNYKISLFMFNIGTFFMSLYFFFRHNNHCEPRAYSYFGICECCVIFSNIGYHATAIIDFKSLDLSIPLPKTTHNNKHS